MSDRQIVHLVVGPVQTNCYLVMNQKTKEDYCGSGRGG